MAFSFQPSQHFFVFVLGNTLELALKRIGRSDIIAQCFNIDVLDQAVARVGKDQGGFDNLKDELGPSRDASLRRNISLDNTYDEQDMMKDSESIESLITERKDSYESKIFFNLIRVGSK